MSERIRADGELQRIQYNNLRDGYRRRLDKMERQRDKAMGLERLSAAEIASNREEVEWGRRWLADLDRAVEQGWAGAIVYCTHQLDHLLYDHVRRVDLLPERNRLIPDAQRGQSVGAGQKRSAEAKKKRREQEASDHRAYVRRQLEEDPDVNITGARRRAVRRFKRSLKTIQRNTLDLGKK